MDELFYSGSGYIQHLSKFNNNEDILTRLLEFSLSIYNYEKSNSNNFSVEIWDNELDKKFITPIWTISDIEINELRNDLNKKIFSSDKFFFAYNKYLYLATKYETKNCKYKIIYYKKLAYYFENSFNKSIIYLNIICFFLLFFLIYIPVNIYHKKMQDKILNNIRVSTISNIINLVKHSLNNQLNVLTSRASNDEIVNRAIHYNRQVLELIDNSNFSSINPEIFIKDLKKFTKIDAKIYIRINSYNLINYINKYLEHAIIVIIDNALHDSVRANIINIKIFQRRFNAKFMIDISNNGKPIEKSIKHKIFSGFTTKNNGHGKGLSNLKEMLNKSSADIILLNNFETTFRILLPCLKDSQYRINKEFLEERKTSEVITINKISNKNIPLVVMIEDEILFWDQCKETMQDAQIIFFKDPDKFFSHIIKMRLKNEFFLSKVDLIICDFNFGDFDLIDSGFFSDIRHFSDDLFKGDIVLCSSYEKTAYNKIRKENITEIKTFIAKRPMNYKEIIQQINLHSFQ